MDIIAALLAPIPVVHLCLHAQLSFWRRIPALLYIFALGLYAVSIFLFLRIVPDNQMFEPGLTKKVIGWTLLIAGQLLALWSLNTLGLKRFLVWGVLRPKSVPKTPETKGPFRLTPHPAYMGYIIMSLGLILITGRVYSLLLATWLLILIPLVILAEEKEINNRAGG